MKIAIATLKALAQQHELTHVIVLAHGKDGMDNVVTYGATVEQCSQAADFGNKLKTALGWPESLQAQPSRVRKLQARVKELEDQVRRIQ